MEAASKKSPEGVQLTPTPQEQRKDTGTSEKDCVSPQRAPRQSCLLLPRLGLPRQGHATFLRLSGTPIPFFHGAPLQSLSPAHLLVHTGPLYGAKIHLGGRREGKASVHSAARAQVPRKRFLCTLRTSSFYVICE